MPKDNTKKMKMEIEGKTYEFPVYEGTEKEKGIDISKLRDLTGHITVDNGYANTSSCESAITFLDGEKGILRYRGIPIEDLAANSSFLEVAYLLIYGHLPSQDELKTFTHTVTTHTLLREDLVKHYDGFP